MIETPFQLASPEAIRELCDRFGYRPEKVKKWTNEKAETILARRRFQECRDLNHGQAQAHTQEAPPCQLTARERTARRYASEYLRQELAERNRDALMLALVDAIFALTFIELRDLAPLLMASLQTDPNSE